ncbi:hypothetical protein ACHAWF_002653 [Thalassiosira exigua]
MKDSEDFVEEDCVQAEDGGGGKVPRTLSWWPSSGRSSNLNDRSNSRSQSRACPPSTTSLAPPLESTPPTTPPASTSPPPQTREAPFSFLEFNYVILQAYDFLELRRRHGARLQLGGSDQWRNIISGVELGRRVDSVQLFALTAPLVTTSDGKNMGKTANGAVWLNADRLSEYDYWQFWRNTDDGDVGRFLKLFTELPLEEIETMERWTGADAKVVLADEATALLHGRECLKAIRDTVDSVFKGTKGADALAEGLN